MVLLLTPTLPCLSQAVIEILRLGKPDIATMDDDKKRETVENYLAFKTLMFKIDKDEDEYDEDGNVIPSGPLVSARELQNLGMPANSAPTTRGGGPVTNGYSAPPPPSLQPSNLPPEMRGMNPIQFNPVIRLQNVPLSSLPGHQLPHDLPRVSERSSRSSAVSAAPVPDSGGYLDPETGDWVAGEEQESEGSRGNTPRAARNTQVGAGE